MIMVVKEVGVDDTGCSCGTGPGVRGSHGGLH